VKKFLRVQKQYQLVEQQWMIKAFIYLIDLKRQAISPHGLLFDKYNE
jgi:hypothetical protein